MAKPGEVKHLSNPRKENDMILEVVASETRKAQTSPTCRRRVAGLMQNKADSENWMEIQA